MLNKSNDGKEKILRKGKTKNMKLNIKNPPPPNAYEFNVKGKSGELECVYYLDPILNELEDLFYQWAFQRLHNGEREPFTSDYERHVSRAS